MRTRPGWSGSLPSHRVVLQGTEPFGQCDVFGAGDVLVAEEQHLVLQQQCLQFGEQLVAARDSAEVDVAHLCADRRRQRVYVEGGAGLRACGSCGDGHCCLAWIGWEGGQDSRSKTEEPMVRPASRSRCACTASSSA